jgi:hypothetical protein
MHKTIVGKSEGKKSFGRPRHKLENDNKMNLRTFDCEDVNSIYI